MLTDSLRSPARAWRRLPWWAGVALVFAAARAVSFIIFVAVARTQPANYWTAADPGYFRYVTIWDADWYRMIAEHGYPAVLPLDASGHVAQNEWAFYPVYPFVVRALHAVTGIGWTVLAPTVSLAAGFGFALIAYRLLRRYLPHGSAMVGIAFAAAFPTSAVLQTGYAESLSLMLLALALLLVDSRRYVAAIPVVAVMDLTRPLGAAFALFMAIHLATRLVRRRREPYPGRQLASSFALGAVSCAGALAWPAIAWAVTGRRDAYTSTEAAWSGGSVQWVRGWLLQSTHLFGELLGPAVLVLVALAMLAGIYYAGRVVGPVMSTWCAAYCCYLLIVFYPQTSLFRIILPLFPLGLALAGASRSKAFRISVLAGFTLLQVVWIAWLWRFTPPSDLPP
ncbi:hypothetical protein [Spelaeicoccus albus]|uniref:Dolichyl-phosphate-mannose-protein mannosyltransferase n=1 Tax=Spelaeicoccus albus TaxID=1280376 RepID=A0A7Z0D395_9MICO|nr:hypothetical protein [Spelaeicoccus albus]NYI68081.1 hypothetical protein [Spelaeicoccus albus]